MLSPLGTHFFGFFFQALDGSMMNGIDLVSSVVLFCVVIMYFSLSLYLLLLLQTVTSSKSLLISCKKQAERGASLSSSAS